MKNKKIVLILISLTLICCVTKTYAVARAVFPNSSSLQPIPSPDVKPNISNNINAQLRTNEIETVDKTQVNDYEKDENQSLAEKKSDNSKLSFGWIISIAMTIGLIILMTVKRLLK